MSLPTNAVLTSAGLLEQILPPDADLGDKERLLAAARSRIEPGMEESFGRFLDWLSACGYEFGSLEDGPPEFGARRVYFRYDVHGQDLLAAYLLAGIHERLKIPGSFQITWEFSQDEKRVGRYFQALRAFDSRYVQFGFHSAPTSTWYIAEMCGDDHPKAREVAAGPEFKAYLGALFAAYERDGFDAAELRRIDAGGEEYLTRTAESFRAAFGDWSTISGHGNFLTRAYVMARQERPEFSVLEPLFHPVKYLQGKDVGRFGFAREITGFGSDGGPGPRVMLESNPTEMLRDWYCGRVGAGLGFVALFHPATWTGGRLSWLGELKPEDAVKPLVPVQPPAPTSAPSPAPAPAPAAVESEPATCGERQAAALDRLGRIVEAWWVARGDAADAPHVVTNVGYNGTQCRSRAANLVRFVEAGYGASFEGKNVCELGSGYGGLCISFALEHKAARVVAVDRTPHYAKALREVAAEFKVPAIEVVEADFQDLDGYRGQMDVVLLNDVMYTSNLDPTRVAAVCHALLKPGGIVLFRNVNRLHGPSVVSHRQGSQFLEPQASDRAARFYGKGGGSTLVHRPLSPAGLMAHLERAGFGDFRYDADTNLSAIVPQKSRFLRQRYVLMGRKDQQSTPMSLRWPPAVERAPFEAAVAANETWHAPAAALQDLFGGELSVEAAKEFLGAYLVDRALLARLRTFSDDGDSHSRDFIAACAGALDRALAQKLAVAAGWPADRYAAADPDRFTTLLGEAYAAVQTALGRTDVAAAPRVDWQEMGARAEAIVLPPAARSDKIRRLATAAFRTVFDDLRHLQSIRLFAETADALVGSLLDEYRAAALDHLEGALLDEAGAARPGPQPLKRQELNALLNAAVLRRPGGARSERTRVVCICGGPRTGTHLLNGILSSSPAVMPMLSETAPLIPIMDARHRAIVNHQMFPGLHFDSAGEIESFFGDAVRSFLDHLRRRYESDLAVIRAPVMSRYIDALFAMSEAAGFEIRVIGMIRSPADAVASLLRWQEKQMAMGKDSLVPGDPSVAALARMFLSYYSKILKHLDANDGRIMVVRYEDLVSEPRAACDRIGTFLGIDLSSCDAQTEWSRTAVDFSEENPFFGTAITDKYGGPLAGSSVGGSRQRLSGEDVRTVEMACRTIIERFYRS